MNSRQAIMIVDDTEMNISILVEALQDNFEVIVAINGLDAIELLEDQKPDLILLDILMPKMDGYDVLKTIKKNSGLEHIPVILLSAITDSGSKTKGFSLGAVDYITKPFEIVEVKARVKTQLRLEEARLGLVSQNIVLEEEKEKLLAELTIANKVLAFQGKEIGKPLVTKSINPLRGKMTTDFNNVVQKIDALNQRQYEILIEKNLKIAELEAENQRLRRNLPYYLL